MITERKELKPLKVRIPNWLGSIESLTEKEKIKPDRFRAVLHQFFLAWIKHGIISKNSKRNLLPDYFSVSSEILKEVGTKNYTRCVDLLIAEKIVERKSGGEKGRCYAIGKHAQLYRWLLPEGQASKPQFRIEYIKDCSTIKSILRATDNHQKLRCKLVHKQELLPVFETLRGFVLDTTMHSGNEEPVDAMDDVHWFVVDEFGERFHHRISTMKKEERKRVRFKGHELTPLVTIDIKNSQPYFSSILSSHTLIEALLPEFIPVIPLAVQLHNKPDFRLYRQLCVSGKFYEYFLSENLHPQLYESERDKIKELIFRAAFYSKKRVFGADKQFQMLFKSTFPSVFSFFSEIKRMDELHLPELKTIIKPAGKVFKHFESNYSYKLLSCLMQRAESRMMYQVIAPKLIEAEIKFITVHDSVMVLPEHVLQTKNIIKESFESYGLVPPTLSIK